MHRYKTISGNELDLTPEQANQLSRLTEIELIGESEKVTEKDSKKNLRVVELSEKG